MEEPEQPQEEIQPDEPVEDLAPEEKDADDVVGGIKAWTPDQQQN